MSLGFWLRTSHVTVCQTAILVCIKVLNQWVWWICDCDVMATPTEIISIIESHQVAVGLRLGPECDVQTIASIDLCPVEPEVRLTEQRRVGPVRPHCGNLFVVCLIF
jgi:hypothetical protein